MGTKAAVNLPDRIKKVKWSEEEKTSRGREGNREATATPPQSPSKVEGERCFIGKPKTGK